MKKFAQALLLLAVLLAATPGLAVAAPRADDPLCLPLPYSNGGSCQPLGSYDYLERMARLGLYFPQQQLPSSSPDPALAYVPFVYAKVTTSNAPVYANPADAATGKPVKRYMGVGYEFISYTEMQEIEGKKVYRMATGEWMRGGDLSRVGSTISYMGLQFSATPTRKFGWMLQNVTAHRAPGAETELSQRQFVRWDVIQVYDIQEADGTNWYLVGADTWVDGKDAALVIPNPTAPAGVDNGRWIEVNLLEQTLAVYENSQLIYATLLSSGVPGFWTRPGLFQIREKVESTPMSGAFEADRSDYYYLEDVPWTMYFDEARALHGEYWHNNLGYEQSHGCVNLSPGDSAWLYRWANVGDWVYVWDSSGRTPTDPSLYGGGGA
jgi:lipoprotein-anchoring transpeptidase ErfK/SrfK